MKHLSKISLEDLSTWPAIYAKSKMVLLDISVVGPWSAQVTGKILTELLKKGVNTPDDMGPDPDGGMSLMWLFDEKRNPNLVIIGVFDRNRTIEVIKSVKDNFGTNLESREFKEEEFFDESLFSEIVKLVKHD
jgi:hypothetical protein